MHQAANELVALTDLFLEFLDGRLAILSTNWKRQRHPAKDKHNHRRAC
jgi:hypothetical protein